MDYDMDDEEYRECLKSHGYIFSDESLSNESSDDEYNQNLLKIYEANKPPPLQIDPSTHNIIRVGPQKKIRQTCASACISRDPQISVSKLTKSQKKRKRKKRKQLESSNNTDVSPKPVSDVNIDNKVEPLYFLDEKVGTTQEYGVAHDLAPQQNLEPHEPHATFRLDKNLDSFKDLSNENLPFSEEENVIEDARTQNKDNMDIADGSYVTAEDVVVSEASNNTNDSSNNLLPIFVKKNVLEDVPTESGDLTTAVTAENDNPNPNISFGDLDSPLQEIISTPTSGAVFYFDEKQEVKPDISSFGEKNEAGCIVTEDGTSDIDTENTGTHSVKMTGYKVGDNASVCDNSVDLQIKKTPKKKRQKSKTAEISRTVNSCVGQSIIPILKEDKETGQHKNDNAQKGCSLESSSHIADAARTDGCKESKKKRRKRGKRNKGKKVIKSSELTTHSPKKFTSEEISLNDPKQKIDESRRDTSDTVAYKKSDKIEESSIDTCSSISTTKKKAMNIDEPKKDSAGNVARRKSDSKDESTVDVRNSKSMTQKEARKVLNYINDIDYFLQVQSSRRSIVSILTNIFRHFNKIIEDNLTNSAAILPQITILEKYLDDLNIPLFNCFCCICNFLRRLAISFENYMSCKDELLMDSKEYLFHVDTNLLETIDAKNYVSDFWMANSGYNKYAYDLLNVTLVSFVNKIVQVINTEGEDLVFLCNDVVKLEYIFQNHGVPYLEKVARAIRKKRKCSVERFRNERYLALFDRKPDSFRAKENDLEKEIRKKAPSSRVAAKVTNSVPEDLPAVADDKVPDVTIRQTEVESHCTGDLVQAEKMFCDLYSGKGDSQTNNVKGDRKDISVEENVSLVSNDSLGSVDSLVLFRHSKEFRSAFLIILLISVFTEQMFSSIIQLFIVSYGHVVFFILLLIYLCSLFVISL